MSARRRRSAAAQSAALATAWSRLAWRTGEMLVASSEVIAARSAQMLAGGVAPDERHRAECTRMVTEKWEASVESGSAVAATAIEQAWRGAGRFWQDALRLQVEVAALATSTTPAQASARWARTVATAVPMLNRSVLDAVERSDAALGPLHRRTGANVRRLRGGKR